MYATLREYEGIEDPEDLKQLLQDGLLAELQALPGFISYYFVDVGEAGDRMISLTVFESHEAAQASNQLAAQWIDRWLTDNLSAPPIVSLVDAGPVITSAWGEGRC